jgi:ferredoxin
MTDLCSIKIQWRDGVESFNLRRGLGLQVLAAKFKTPLEFDCRKADCGVCVVKILGDSQGLSPIRFEERDFLKAMHADPDERLACQCRVTGDVSFKIEY